MLYVCLNWKGDQADITKCRWKFRLLITADSEHKLTKDESEESRLRGFPVPYNLHPLTIALNPAVSSKDSTIYESMSWLLRSGVSDINNISSESKNKKICEGKEWRQPAVKKRISVWSGLKWLSFTMHVRITPDDIVAFSGSDLGLVWWGSGFVER